MDPVRLLVWVGIIAILAIAIWYVLTQIPLDPMLKRILTIVIVIVAAIFAIVFLAGIGGVGAFHI